MSHHIYVEKVNEAMNRCYIEDEGIARQVYDFFKFTQPNFKPSRFSRWDGTVRLYDLRTGKLASGLLQILLVFCREQGYKIQIDPRLNTLTKVEDGDLKEWVRTLDLVIPGETYRSDPTDIIAIDPYDYQFEALKYAIKMNKATILAATGAGKSLIAYLLTRYYEMNIKNEGEKTLIVVPSAKLVDQLKMDFKAYSIRNGWDADANIHQIYDGARKTTHKPVIIATWQSIQDEDAEYFEQFGKLIVDECHGAGADKLSGIAKQCNRAHQRVGMTATLRNSDMHQLQVQANFGPIKRVVSTRELQELGQAADTMIRVVTMDYSATDRAFVQSKSMSYQDEIDWLIRHPERNKMIKGLAMQLKGNSLFLFNRNEDHLEIIYEELRHMKDHVYMINGDVKMADRAAIESIMETGDNVTLLASYGTMSTGISIKKMHNLVLCHPSKSLVRILQSIGRLLRIHSSKERATIIDIVDNLSIPGKGYRNYAVDHAVERFGFYKNEGHKTSTSIVKVIGSFTNWSKPKPKKKEKKSKK